MALIQIGINAFLFGYVKLIRDNKRKGKLYFLFGGRIVKINQNRFWNFLRLFFALYLFLYIGYLFFIYILHISFSVISLAAIILPLIFLLIMLFVFRGFTNTKLQSDRKVKKEYNAIIILGITAPLLGTVLLGVNEYQAIFTTEKWLQSEKEKVYMVDDLVNDYELNEMTENEVISLLGTPSETEYFKSDNNFVYYLGYERGLISIDSEWLVIDFDDNKKVKKYQVVTD